MRTVIKVNKVIATLFDKEISLLKKRRNYLQKMGSRRQLRSQDAIRINENYNQIRYTNGELLPKGMEAHIIALIKGGLS
jgi:hypothetical protein